MQGFKKSQQHLSEDFKWDSKDGRKNCLGPRSDSCMREIENTLEKKTKNNPNSLGQ
jgi:hypothetical protein